MLLLTSHLYFSFPIAGSRPFLFYWQIPSWEDVWTITGFIKQVSSSGCLFFLCYSNLSPKLVPLVIYAPCGYPRLLTTQFLKLSSSLEGYAKYQSTVTSRGLTSSLFSHPQIPSRNAEDWPARGIGSVCVTLLKSMDPKLSRSPGYNLPRFTRFRPQSLWLNTPVHWVISAHG